MKLSLNNIADQMSNKVRVPDHIHFIWFGDKGALFDNYLNIWQRTNPEMTCQLWIDESSSTCLYFHNIISDYAKCHHPCIAIEWSRKIKNEAFAYIYPRLNDKQNFNTLAKKFLLTHSLISDKDSFHPADLPTSLSKKIIVKDINTLFNGIKNELHKYLYYELILRGNMASASDIARLLILYRHGGIYIDIDTLPYFDNFFEKTNQFMKDNGIIDNQFIALAKTEAMLSKIDSRHTEKMSPDHYLKNSSFLCQKKRRTLIKKIHSDTQHLTLGHIQPLSPVIVYKNILALASIPRLKGIYYNNVIAALPASKTIAIILRSVKKRYRYLEKNNAITHRIIALPGEHYLSRLLPWREEADFSGFSVTPVLTGPGLILEVLLALAYTLVDIGETLQPAEVAELMQNERFGVAFFQHTLDTPAGLTSAWRTQDSLAADTPLSQGGFPQQ